MCPQPTKFSTWRLLCADAATGAEAEPVEGSEARREAAAGAAASGAPSRYFRRAGAADITGTREETKAVAAPEGATGTKAKAKAHRPEEAATE